MSRKAISVRFDPDLLEEAEAYIEKHGMQKAELFEEAVREFMDSDRNARVEQKIDGLIKSMGEDPSHLRKIGQGKENIEGAEIEPPSAEVSTGNRSDGSGNSDTSQKKSGGEYTDGAADDPVNREPPSDEELSDGPFPMKNKHTDGIADRMVNYLILEVRETGKPAITHNDIVEAIKLFGGSTDHYFKTYPEKIDNRLSEQGWYYNPLRGWWYEEKEKLQQHLRNQWEEAVEIVNRGLDLDTYDTEEAYQRLHNHEDKKETVETLLDNDIADKDEITHVLFRIGKHVDRLENDRQKVWGNN